MRLNKKHDFPGKLIVVEGVDGSGKSTQLDLLRNWLISRGQSVIFTEWNSSRLISKTIKQAKRSNSLIPNTFSLLHATDFADRLENIIIPALKAGLVVLADRYCFTAFARDVARGVDREWVRNLYGFSVRPDGAFYAFADISQFGMTAKDFSLKLLDEENVACVPGTAFGACGEGFIRCSYATSLDQIKEAMKRIARFIEKL